MTKSVLSILTVIALIVSLIDCAQVTYYSDANFGGAQHSVDLRGKCHTLNKFDNRISSIDSHGNCVVIFSGRGCRGKSFRVAPGTVCHRNLNECGLNDKVTSMRLC